MIKQILGVMAIATALTACAGKSADNANAAATDSVKAQTTMTNPDTTVLIKTSEGDITVRVYGDTPKHQANFLKLVREGYYNNTLFHRVINEFMVQAGDPDSREAKPGQQLGAGGPDYTIEAEIAYPKHFHKRGALAAARQGDQSTPRNAPPGRNSISSPARKSRKPNSRLWLVKAPCRKNLTVWPRPICSRYVPCSSPVISKV